MARMGTVVEPSGGVTLLGKWVMEAQAHIKSSLCFLLCLDVKK